MKTLLYNYYTVGLIVLILSESLLKTPLQNLSILLNLFLTVLFGLLFLKFLVIKVDRNSISKKILLYLLLLCLPPFIAAYKAYVIFNQNYIDGFLANSKYYNFLVFFYVYYLFKYKKNALVMLKNSMLFLGWVFLIAYYSVRITMPDYRIIFDSFDGYTTYDFGVSTLGSILFIGIAFYYLAKYTHFKKTKYLLGFLFFLGYDVIFTNARIAIFSVFIALAVYFFKEFKTTLRIKFIFSAFSFLIILVTIASLVPPVQEFLTNKIELFTEAKKVLSGAEGDDMSANARLWQIETASRYIDHSILGAGTLKSSTKNLYLTDYFYPEDIGLIGIVFSYGLVGLLLLSYQIKLFYTYFKNNFIKQEIVIKSILYFLLSIYIKSIFTGQFVYSIGFTMFLLSIVIVQQLTVKKEAV